MDAPSRLDSAVRTGIPDHLKIKRFRATAQCLRGDSQNYQGYFQTDREEEIFHIGIVGNTLTMRAYTVASDSGSYQKIGEQTLWRKL